MHVTATVDGQVVFEDDAHSGDAGTFPVEFRLPDTIVCGEGHLRVAVVDGSVRQSITKPIPIKLRRIDVAFYPEGGNLVAGLENRVYFAGRNPLGKPVRFSGVILASRAGGSERHGDNERPVRAIETICDGMGVFSLVPRAGETYRLKITEPEGMETDAKLPEVAAGRDVLLTTGTGVFAAGQPVQATVQTAKAGLPLVVAADCRGVEVGQQALVAQTGAEGNAVTLPLDDAAGGVIRLSVYDYSTSPPKLVAQRLVYRRPAQWLNVQTAAGGTGLASGTQRYAPGESVDLPLRSDR